MVGDIRNAFYQTMSFNWLFTVQVARHPHHSQSTLRFLLHGLPIVLGPSHAFWKKNFFEHVVADHSSLPQSFYVKCCFRNFFARTFVGATITVLIARTLIVHAAPLERPCMETHRLWVALSCCVKKIFHHFRADTWTHPWYLAKKIPSQPHRQYA